MKKILEVRYPDVRGLPDHAFFLSSILDDKEVDKWLSNQYIHITCNKNFVERNTLGFDFFMDYYRCPYLEISYLPNVLVRDDREKTWDLLKQLLEENYYIALSMDENIVPNRQFYQCGKATYHNNFLYGYDESRVYLGCFDRIGKYIFEALPIELFLRALWIDEEHKLRLSKRVKNDRYDINNIYIYRSLEDYIRGTDLEQEYAYCVSDRVSKTKAYGWNVYEYMMEFYFTLNCTGIELDLRPIFMLIEQKRCMLKRLEVLECNVNVSTKEYQADYINMVKELNIALNYLIKYSFCGKIDCLKRASEKIGICREKEKNLFSDLIVFYKEVKNYG